MTAYIVYIAMTIILAILFDGQDNSRKKQLWYGITCLFLILLSGFRNGVGGDTQCYMLEFDYVPTHASDYHEYIMENVLWHSYMPGWSVLNILCKNLFDSFYAVQLIEAIIVNTCIFYLFSKYTKRVFLSALLFAFTGYVFIFNTEVMREAVAISLIGVGMYKYMNGHKWIFYLTVLIGISFHISACVALLFPFMRFFKEISYKTLLIAFICSLVLWIGSNSLLLALFDHLSGESSLVASGFIRCVFNFPAA